MDKKIGDKNMSNKLCITFDLDDTLIPTQEKLYDVSREELSIYVADLLNGLVKPNEVLDKFSEIDMKNISEYGFSKKRYPTSWVQTLTYFVGEKSTLLEQHVHTVEKLANWIFEESLQPYPIVSSLLSELRKANDMMYILTAGDVEVQQKRIKDSGLSPYFKDTVIVPVKNPEVMKEYLADKLDYVHVMVGNSLRSDIYPALECGMHAIHIEQGGWSYDHFEVDKTHGNYYKCSLEDIPRVIEQLKTKNL